MKLSVLCAMVCGVLFTGGWHSDAQHAAFAYLTAYCTVLSTCLGALGLLCVLQVTGARWFAPMRGVCEWMIAPLPVLGVLFVPIVMMAPRLYAWVQPSDIGDAVIRNAVLAKADWL